MSWFKCHSLKTTMSLFPVKLPVVLIDPGGLSATQTLNKTLPPSLPHLSKPKRLHLTILLHIKQSSKSQICVIAAGPRAAQISTCWPARHQTSYKNDPESAPVGFKASFSYGKNTHPTDTCSSVTYLTSYNRL